SLALEQLLYANHVAGSETMETLEDIYIGSVETHRGTREQVRLCGGHEFPRHYLTFADGFVLVYSIDSKESFKLFVMHRLHTTRSKLDLQDQRRVDSEAAQQWARQEKVRLWEVSVTDRRTLIEPFVHLASKMTQPQSKSTFPLSHNKNKGSGSLDS
uniref:NF-kappa-B inhibitor-interacting Ras-like protein 2 n=1 Tax=Sinocyclocheilus grahami TaxID=75366 RepID=A0A672RBB4_SINGR